MQRRDEAFIFYVLYTLSKIGSAQDFRRVKEICDFSMIEVPHNLVQTMHALCIQEEFDPKLWMVLIQQLKPTAMSQEKSEKSFIYNHTLFTSMNYLIEIGCSTPDHSAVKIAAKKALQDCCYPTK